MLEPAAIASKPAVSVHEPPGNYHKSVYKWCGFCDNDAIILFMLVSKARMWAYNDTQFW